MPSRSSKPRNLSGQSQSEMPLSSQQALAVLLRTVGQVLETWADRLEAAIIQVTATLPDPQVRQDILAKLWRLWLTIVSQITRRCPVRWRVFVAGVLPIALVGLCFSLGLWGVTSVFWGAEIQQPPGDISENVSEDLEENLPSPLSLSLESENSQTDIAQTTNPPDRNPPEHSDDRPPEVSPEIAGLPLESLEPLGPPIPDWSTLSFPLEQKVQAQLIGKLSPTWKALVQRIQVNFNQQELTVYLTDQWQTLTNVEQHRFVEICQQQARQLDFPHLRFMDEHDRLLARTAIVGEGIIFQNRP